MQGLPISINDIVILPFREGFIFTKLRKINSSRNFPNLQNVADVDVGHAALNK